MDFIAFSVKGLEKVVVDEIKERISDAKIIETSSKRVLFSSDASFEQLITLRTADDIGVLVGKKTDYSSLESILDLLQRTDFYTVKETLQSFKTISPDTFSLTLSLTRVKGLKAPEVEQEVSQYFQNRYKWRMIEKDHTNFDIRLFIDGTMLYISVRLTPYSLHHRSYKTESQAGSLRPTIAAAMVRLATNNKQGLKVVDTFCGSGTILCESLLMGQDVYGGDIDPDAVAITTHNLSYLTSLPPDKVRVQSATETKWHEHSFDVAISNLPWDKQIAVKSITDLYRGTLNEYKRILKEESTLCMLVSKPELFIKHAKAVFPEARIESHKISFTGQSPTIVLLTNSEYNKKYDLV